MSLLFFGARVTDMAGVSVCWEWFVSVWFWSWWKLLGKYKEKPMSGSKLAAISNSLNETNLIRNCVPAGTTAAGMVVDSPRVLSSRNPNSSAVPTLETCVCVWTLPAFVV